VELDAEDRVMPVTNAHHGAVLTPRIDDEGAGDARSVGDERVVAHGFEGTGQVSEDAVVVMMDGAGLAVHHMRLMNRVRCSNDASTVKIRSRVRSASERADVVLGPRPMTDRKVRFVRRHEPSTQS
jgi:hypothetical protein